MGHLKDSIYYKEAIQVVERPFGTFYLFDTFIVSEINEGVTFTWEDHAKELTEELTTTYDQNGQGMIYISNRVHSYSVKPNDWIKFFKNNYSLKGYGIVSYNKPSLMTSLIEKLFMRSTFRNFGNLDEAISWARNLDSEK